jgi:uncharacterized protein
MFLDGKGGDTNAFKARTLYAKACDAEDAKGCYNMGLMLEGGIGGKADLTRSKILFAKACRLGNKTACAVN